MNRSALPTANAFASDPLARFLLGRRVPPLAFGLGFFIAGLLYLFGLSAVFDVLRPWTPGVVAGLYDHFNQVNFLFVFPVTAFFFLWQPAGIAGVYAAVTGALPAAPRRTFTIVRLASWHDRSFWWIPGLLLGLVGVGLGVADNLNKIGHYWYAVNGLMIAILQLARFLELYMLMTIAMRHIATSIGLNRIYSRIEFPVSVIPARRSDLLRAITGFALRFAAIAGVAALNLGLAPLLSTPTYPEYYVFVGFYLLLMPAGFLLPLWQVHARMAASKEGLLKELSGEYQREYARFVGLARSRSAGDQAQRGEAQGRLQALQEAINLTERTSTWPFQLGSIYRFMATALFPFIFTLFDLAMRLVEFER